MTDILTQNPSNREMERLKQERVEILSLPPESALNRILNSSQPVILIHSFSDEDFYFLIREIGVEDSLELLSMASDRQWEFILDVELWKKDRIRQSTAVHWIDLILKADPNRLLRWSLNEKTEFIEWFLFKNIEIKIREHDQDPGIFGDEYITFDDIYYIRIIPISEELRSEEDDDALRKETLTRLLTRLANFDHLQYQKLLLEASHILPAESEEELFRLRNVRMAEKGFFPFDEAMQIYSPLKSEDLKNVSLKYPGGTRPDSMLPVPLSHIRALQEENLFTRSLEKIPTQEVLIQIQTEFASLCNQIISADMKTIRHRAELKGIVKKACGYLTIGLEQLDTRAHKNPDPNRTAALVSRYPLSDIFRVGFGEAMALKWQAERWRTSAWFQKHGLGLTFWGENGLGVLGGLFIKKPLFFDNHKTGVLYRDFTSVDELAQTKQMLEDIIRIDHLLSLVNIDPSAYSALDFFTFKNFILTSWAKNHLNPNARSTGENRFVPLELDEFHELFLGMWEMKDGGRRVRKEIKESFLTWLANRTGLSSKEILTGVGYTLEALFNEAESEYQEVSADDLDPRFIHLFLIRGKHLSETADCMQ
ncbi:MAG: DUF6178 family protein [Thermodesulfobacteriota bacterium]